MNEDWLDDMLKARLKKITDPCPIEEGKKLSVEAITEIYNQNMVECFQTPASRRGLLYVIEGGKSKKRTLARSLIHAVESYSYFDPDDSA